MFLTTIALIGLQFNPTDTIEPKKEVLGEVRVTATVRKETVTGVIQSMRLSPVVMDGISQETIKRSPDRNLGETLKRVGGTTIQNDRFVTVRGLSDRYNTVMINGAMFTSTEPDRRAFSFDIIPTNVVDNMTISKTFCANLPGDFAGGAIQINTKSDFTDKTNNITLGFSYGSLSTFNQGRYVNFTNLPSSFPTTKEFRISELNQRKEFTNLLPIQYNPVTKTNLPNLNLNYSYINKWRWGNKGLGIVTNFSYRNSNSIQYNERKDYQSPNELAYVYNDVVYTNTSNISWLFNPTYIKNKSKFTFKNLLNYQDENTFMVRHGDNYDNLQSLNYTNTIGYKSVRVV